jgi:hypothetical protein
MIGPEIAMPCGIRQTPAHIDEASAAFSQNGHKFERLSYLLTEGYDEVSAM